MEQNSQSQHVDNWNCARQIDIFFARVLDPLTRKVEETRKYVNEGYEKKCKEKGIPPDPKRLNQLTNVLRQRVKELQETREFYDATKILIRRHEALTTSVYDFQKNFEEKVLYQDQVPAELLSGQRQMIMDYFLKFKEMTDACDSPETD